MKKQVLIAFSLVVVALIMNSCFGTPEVTFSQSDLYGLWLQDGTQHYVRFTSEQSDETPYLYGREWNEDEDKHEEDLVLHGNGWFKYKLVKADLTQIHLMDNGGADIPKVYVVSVLTDDRLEYYEEDMPSRKFKYNKVVAAK